MLPIRENRRDGALFIHEIFPSIQGESTRAGEPCTFIRTVGCHLRCNYCDTEHAFFDGKMMDFNAIIARVRELRIPLVEVTGGEPLLHQEMPQFLSQLCDEGFEVMLETSGAVSIEKVDPRVQIILDVKTPGSGEHERNILSNLALDRDGMEVKFVICDRADFEFSKNIIHQHNLEKRMPVLLSPAHEILHPKQLVTWMLADNLNARLNLQQHKYIWGDIPGV